MTTRAALNFTPVPTKARHDGWTPARQSRFIEALAAAKSVTRACKAVGKSAVTAYALRKHPGAESFATAWDAALAFVSDSHRQRSSRAARRLSRAPSRVAARLTARPKANEVGEIDDPPGSPPPPAQASSAFQDLEALLTHLRSRT
jgi:hypothetical protein